MEDAGKIKKNKNPNIQNIFLSTSAWTPCVAGRTVVHCKMFLSWVAPGGGGAASHCCLPAQCDAAVLPVENIRPGPATFIYFAHHHYRLCLV